MKRYTYRGIRKMAKQDSRNWRWKFWPLSKAPKDSQPELTQTIPAEYEKELKEAGGSEIRRLSSDWECLDSKLKPKYGQILSKIRSLRELFRLENEEVQIAKKQHDEASRKYCELHVLDLSKFWMIFWLMIIGAAEFPLNGLIFSIFGEGRILTYIMAGVLCVGIPIIAHWVGQTLRQESKSRMDWMIISIIPIIFIALLFAIGFLRAKYLATLLTQMPIGLFISPAMATFLFLIFNVAFFIIAGIISYAGSHPQHSLFNTRTKRLKETFAIFKKASGKAEIISHELANEQKKLAKEKYYREKKWKWYYEKASEVKKNAGYFMATYRKANMEGRQSAVVPKCFYPTILEPDIPNNLLELDWECSDMTETENLEAT